LLDERYARTSADDGSDDVSSDAIIDDPFIEDRCIALFVAVAPGTGTYTARRLRALARRALMMARPPRVFIRTRKPCVRLRFTMEGW